MIDNDIKKKNSYLYFALENVHVSEYQLRPCRVQLVHT